jgi:iron complex outermembrane recepter protein
VYSNDGYYENHNPLDAVVRGTGLGGGDSRGVRVAALWQPTDNLTMDASVSYTENEFEPRAVAKVSGVNTWYKEGQRVPQPTGPDGDTDPRTNMLLFSRAGLVDYAQWLGTVKSVREEDINLSRSYRNDQPFQGSKDDSLLSYVRFTLEGDSLTYKSLTSFLVNKAFLHEDVDFQDGIGTLETRFNEDPNNPGQFTIPVFHGFSLDNDYLDRTNTRYYGQEFTVESTAWDRGRWLVGASGFWEDTRNHDESLGWFNDPAIAEALPLFCDSRDRLDLACDYRSSERIARVPKITDRDSTSYSLFALVGYELTDTVTATAEVRYIKDTIEVGTNTRVDRVAQYVLNIPIDDGLAPGEPLYTADTQRSATVNPRFALDIKASDDVLVYASVAKGTKPAGFGTAQFAVPQNTKVDQEQLWGYEVGVKSEWFDRRVQANAALFFNEYTDRQIGVTVVNETTGWASAGVVNAGGAETKGFELDAQWAVTDNLTLAMAYAFTDAVWTDYNFYDIRNKGKAPDQRRNPTLKDRAICQDRGIVVGGLPNGDDAFKADCAGAKISGIPEHSANFQANYTASLTDTVEWFASANISYDDKRPMSDKLETAYTDSNYLIDTQVGLQGESWDVQLYVKNLLDDDTVRFGQQYQDFRDGMFGGSAGGEPRDEVIFGFLPDPRIIGFRATYRFSN